MKPQRILLTPPRLTKDTLLKPLVCTRPLREEQMNLDLEMHGNKRVLNCYGHGGAGWTTLFGSVKKTLQHLGKEKKKQPVRVLGSGCIGLTCAIELSRLGYPVTGIFSRELYDLASWKAAGYFGLLCMKEREDLNEIGLETFLTYQAIQQGQHPYIPPEIVRFMPVYCSLDTVSGVEDLEKRGLIPKREEVTLDFANGVVHPGFVKYMTFFINTTLLMQALLKEVHKRGIAIEKREIHSFQEVPEELICNCTGMGASTLCNDTSLSGVRGHLMTLNQHAGHAHMDYMIYTKVLQEGKEEYVYLFPKNWCVTVAHPTGIPCYGALGGSFIKGGDSSCDAHEIKRLLERNSQFFQGHARFL